MRPYFFCVVIAFYYPLAWLGVLYGEHWALLAFFTVIGSQFASEIFLKQELAEGRRCNPIVGQCLLYLHLPFAFILLLLLLWQAAPGDQFSIGEFWGGQIASSHQAISFVEILECALLTGYLFSLNTIAAHELVHRKKSSPDYFIGRLLLILNSDSQFSTSHIYGHHRVVGTLEDPATARRGESLYRFVVRSALGQYGQAFLIQRRFLVKKNRSMLSAENELIWGILFSLCLILAFGVFFSCLSLLAYLVAAFVAKYLFESMNYIQHYGLIRVPGAPVQPRHSWDSVNPGATQAYYALTYHSAHHCNAARPFWELKPGHFESDNHLKHGFVLAIVLAMIPPLWFRYMEPVLAKWDETQASSQEAGYINEYYLDGNADAIFAGKETSA